MSQFTVKDSKAADGRTLIVVQFIRQAPDDTEPSINVIFQYVFPESFCVTATNPGVLVQLSTTREDTLEPAVLTDEERQLCYTAASEYLAGLLKD